MSGLGVRKQPNMLWKSIGVSSTGDTAGLWTTGPDLGRRYGRPPTLPGRTGGELRSPFRVSRDAGSALDPQVGTRYGDRPCPYAGGAVSGSGFGDLVRARGVLRIIAAQLTARFPSGMLSLGLLFHVEGRTGSYGVAGVVLAALSIGAGRRRARDRAADGPARHPARDHRHDRAVRRGDRLHRAVRPAARRDRRARARRRPHLPADHLRGPHDLPEARARLDARARSSRSTRRCRS